jgi:hypothetical protein
MLVRQVGQHDDDDGLDADPSTPEAAAEEHAAWFVLFIFNSLSLSLSLCLLLLLSPSSLHFY